MGFRVPSARELTDEQRAVYDLPLDGRYLISGPPGSGKTILALLRTERLVSAGRRPSFLVFNRALQAMVKGEAAKRGVGDRVHTYHSWVSRMYRTAVGREAPKLDEWVYDWSAIAEHAGQIFAARESLDLADVIVDESQDLPAPFFSLLHGLGANLTVFADENQTLTHVNSTIGELRRALAGPAELDVKTNFRNTRPVAELAREFYTGTATGMPALPDRPGEVSRLVRCDDLRTFAKAVCRVALLQPARNDLGVFALYKDTRDELGDLIADNFTTVAAELGATRSESDANRIFDRAVALSSKVHVPARGRPPAPLNEDGIFVVTHASGKGLEFDSAFIWLDGLRRAPDTDARMRMYVLSTRPRHELYLGWRGTGAQKSATGVPPWVASIGADLLRRVRSKP